MAVFIHVSERDPIRAWLTSDLDAAIDRLKLPLLIEVARKAGWTFRHYRRRLIFLNEKVRPEYAEALSRRLTDEGILVAPVADLVRMKLTSYRLKDLVHFQDRDGVGLITPEIERQFVQTPTRSTYRDPPASNFCNSRTDHPPNHWPPGPSLPRPEPGPLRDAPPAGSGESFPPPPGVHGPTTAVLKVNDIPAVT